MTIFLKQSDVDPLVFEVVEGSVVLEEVEIPFYTPRMRIPKRFDSLGAIRKWLSETEWKRAKNYALHLLNARSYASVTLRKKLEKRKYSASICERVIEEMNRFGYLQDDLFLERLILSEFKKGKGPRYIEAKLKSKGLPTQKVRELISREDQIKQIRQLLKKIEQKKALGKLQRSGFDIDLILQNLLNTTYQK